MFSCFYVYESKKKRPRNTKEMKTKPKRLKLLFAIICNNLVKQEKKNMIELHLYSTSNSHQAHIKVKTRQCMHICCIWRGSSRMKNSPLYMSDDGYPVISVHLSKMERTDRTFGRHFFFLFVVFSLVCSTKPFAVLFACRWDGILIPFKLTTSPWFIFILFLRNKN